MREQTRLWRIEITHGVTTSDRTGEISEALAQDRVLPVVDRNDHQRGATRFEGAFEWTSSDDTPEALLEWMVIHWLLTDSDGDL